MTADGDAGSGPDARVDQQAARAAPPGAAARRELQLAVLLGLVGAALVLLAVRQTWLSVASPDALTIDTVRVTVRGTSVSSLAQPAGLVGVAGVLAIAATKRLGRSLVGALVLLAAVAVTAEVLAVLSRGVLAVAIGHADSGCSSLQDGTGQCLSVIEDVQESTLWPVLTVVGAVALAAAGLLVAVRGRRWAALSSSYQPPVAREQAPPATDKGVWDALDRGDDPTT